MKKIVQIILLYILLFSCTEAPPPNPFDLNNHEITDSIMIDSINYASNSLVALQHNIFSPTCANSGCHDGTFEPDFRTIESSYNTLINHPIIKNDPDGTYESRVVPFRANESVLLTRITIDIDGQSGIMPLEFEDTDWIENKEEYIQNIREWINNGAPDILGNLYTPVDNKPRTLGIVAKINNIILPRGDAGKGPIIVPQGSNSIDIFIALSDDNTNITDLSNTALKFSRGPVDFDSSLAIVMQVLSSPFSDEGFTGDQVNYTYRSTVNFTSDTLFNVNQVYFRTYANDGFNGTTQAPSENSALYLKRYFSIIKE